MILKFFFSFLVAVLIFFGAEGQSDRHVILITIDGFRPDFYLDESWGAVNIRQMMADGAYAEGVNSVFPSVTYPSHTTIITGALPVNHGVYFNNPFEPEGSTGHWNWEFEAIKSPSLWEAAGNKNLTTASVYWPVSVGAPIDYNVPVIRPIDKNTGRVEITEKNVTPKGLLTELEKGATGKLSADNMQNDDNAARMAGYLIKKYKPHFMTVHLVDVDHSEHVEGREGQAVRRAVATADHAVGVIMEAVEKAGLRENTSVIVTGDHGFVNKHTSLSPNVWLVKAGLMEANRQGDWKAQFHTAGGSAFLYLRDQGDKKTLEKVEKLLSELPLPQKRLFRVVDRDELIKMGANPEVGLALAAKPGIVFNGAAKGKIIRGTHGGSHGYFPDFYEIQTGFIAYGAGFRKGVVIPAMRLEDIAPLVARILQIDFKSPDGILYPGILRE